nr:streptococcal hemagglutinin-like [Procambarus clarkii]
MAVSSTRRGLATKAVRRAGARMALSLLGTNNPKHNLTMADHLLTISARDFAKKWNFDPIKEVPLATGRYDWCSAPQAHAAHDPHAPHAHAHAAHDPHDLRTCLALPTADLRHSQGGVGDLSAHPYIPAHTHIQAHAHVNSQSSTSTNQRHTTAINTPETEESLEVKEDVCTAPEGDGASTRASTSATPSATPSASTSASTSATPSASTSAKGKQEASATSQGAVGTEEQAEARPTTSAKKHKEEHVTEIEFGTEEKAEDRPKAGARGEEGAPGPQGGAGTVPTAQGTSAASPPVPAAAPGRSARQEAVDTSTSTTLPRHPTTRQTCITEYVRPHRSSKSSSRDPDHTSPSKKRSASTLKDHLHQPPHKKVLLQIRA